MLISNIDGQVHATWEALLAELLGPLLHDCIAQAQAAQNTATGLLQQQMGAAIDSMVLQPPDVSAPMFFQVFANTCTHICQSIFFTIFVVILGSWRHPDAPLEALRDHCGTQDGLRDPSGTIFHRFWTPFWEAWGSLGGARGALVDDPGPLRHIFF